MSAIRVLVCDDNRSRAQAWADSIDRLGVDVQRPCSVLGADGLRQAASALKERERASRSSVPRRRKPAPTDFDGIGVAFIDYDLLRADHLDGENLARMVRCFSDTAVIVVVNREHRDFDLSLRCDAASWADIELSDSSITSRGLWEEPWGGFRPWHWPLLPLAVQRFRRLSRSFAAELDKPLAGAVGLPDDVLAVLPTSTWEQVSRGVTRGRSTVRDMVSHSPMGLRPKEKLPNDAAVARVAVARLTKWMAQVVLPGQNIVVDAPHLVSRLPSLLRVGRRPEEEALSAVCTIGGTLPKSFDSWALRRHVFDANGLLDRPAWVWPSIAKDTSIPDIAEPWKTRELGSVFCEDVSRFVPKAAARRFTADIDSPYAARFVVNPRSRRLAARLKKAVKGMSYEPAARFAL